MKTKKTNNGHTIEIEYYPFLDKDNEEIRQFRKEVANTQAIDEDLELKNTIVIDMSQIWEEVGGQDGMYDNFPITRVYRSDDSVRVYALDGDGGVAIISKNNRFKVVTLGEDDAYHFLNSRSIYENYCGNKSGFVCLLSEALSLFNNIEI